MEQLLNAAAASLRKAAMNEEAKAFVLGNDVLFKTLKKAADRYIGGETLAETLVKVLAQQALGFKTSIEDMGENTSTAAEAAAVTAEFLRVCEAIAQQGSNTTVSLDLSHIGLTVSPELCREHLDQICVAAARAHAEVIISAEDTDKTDAILNTYLDTVKVHPHLAITMQAYLHRSKDDFKTLLQAPGRIRLVKGAFAADPALALPRGHVLDEAYLHYADQLLSSGHLCAIATHHHTIQQAVKTLITRHQADKTKYEFESLFGICNEQLGELQAEGYPTKIYFVYGKEWYLYLCNRIAEHPLNLFQALSDIVGG